MTPVSTLLELAKRAEEATGPDCCLDFCIYEALGNEYEMIGKFGVWKRAGAQWPATADSVPPYTASIDAALTLVPEGWRKSIIDADNGNAIVELWQDEGDGEVGAQAATAALALVAASLRARSSEQGAGE